MARLLDWRFDKSTKLSTVILTILWFKSKIFQEQNRGTFKKPTSYQSDFSIASRNIINLLLFIYILKLSFFPAGIYLLKVNNRNTRTRCEICSKLTKKIPERRPGIFIVKFEHISHLVRVSIVNFEHEIDGWVVRQRCCNSCPFLLFYFSF